MWKIFYSHQQYIDGGGNSVSESNELWTIFYSHQQYNWSLLSNISTNDVILLCYNVPELNIVRSHTGLDDDKHMHILLWCKLFVIKK